MRRSVQIEGEADEVVLKGLSSSSRWVLNLLGRKLDGLDTHYKQCIVRELAKCISSISLNIP